MEFNEIISKALQIRQKYSELEKNKYGREWSTQEISLGLVGDIGDLAKLIQAKEGVRESSDVESKLAHELSDCLWSIIVLANRYNVDLEKSFLDTMDQLDNKLKNK